MPTSCPGVILACSHSSHILVIVVSSLDSSNFKKKIFELKFIGLYTYGTFRTQHCPSLTYLKITTVPQSLFVHRLNIYSFKTQFKCYTFKIIGYSCQIFNAFFLHNPETEEHRRGNWKTFVEWMESSISSWSL